MGRWRRIAVLVIAGAAIAATETALAARSNRADPRKAAVALERSLHGIGRTKLVHRNGGLWLGISKDSAPNRERLWV